MRRMPIAIASWLLPLALALVLALAPPAFATEPGSAATEPPRRIADRGRLLATSGIATVEGAAGGGLVPWAVVAGHGTRDAIGAAANATAVRLPDFSLYTTGAAFGLFDRLELSYQHQWLDTRAAGAALGLGRGYTIEGDVFGAKLRLFGDLIADQDRWWPQVAVGLQYKVAGNRALVRALGARDTAGFDTYVSATKLLLQHALLLNGTIRLTRANQLGLLGHGGDRNDSHRPQFEASAAYLLARDVAIGAEFRSRPDNLGFAREGRGWDVFAAWFPAKGVSLTLAYVDLGPVAGFGRQDGVFLSLQAGF